MIHATEAGTSTSKAGDLVVHLTHAKLFTVGLVAVAWLGSTYLQHDPVVFADTGIMGVRDVVLEQSGQVPAPISAPASISLSVAEPVPAREKVEGLSAEMERVRDYVARRYRVSSVALEPVLAAAEHRGRSSGIDPLLIVAVMAIESSFNPLAVSSMGAQGLMQVIPRFHMDKIGENRRKDALFDPLLNVRVGTEVLVEGLRRFGSLQTALQYYGGALSDPEAGYANKVLAMKRRLVVAAGRSAGTDA